MSRNCLSCCATGVGRRGLRSACFPGQNPTNPMTAAQLNRAVTAAKNLAGISKRVSPHTPPGHSPASDLVQSALIWFAAM